MNELYFCVNNIVNGLRLSTIYPEKGGEEDVVIHSLDQPKQFNAFSKIASKTR